MAVGPGQVALATQPDGQQVGLLVAAHHDCSSIGGHRSRDRVPAQAGSLPNQLAVLQIVAGDEFRGGNNHLLSAADGGDHGAGPG